MEIQPVYKISDLSNLNKAVRKIVAQQRAETPNFMNDDKLSRFVWT